MQQIIKRIPNLFFAFALPGLFLALLFSNLQPAQADVNNIYRVAKTGDGTNGLSWSTAFTDVQDALGTAISVDEIWVAGGIYIPGSTVNATFQLVDGVGIYGGFAATETLRTQRKWEANTTVLSGDIGGDDTTDSNGVVTDTTNISGTNICHVVTGSGVGSSAVLDGFTITAGQAGSEFCNEMTGGGMYNDSGSPTLNNVTFSGNVAYYGGGGISNDNGSSPTLNNVTFSENVASYGGGMYNWDSSPTLTEVTFSRNVAYYGGGGMRNRNNSNPTLTNLTFSENWAERGGGMYNYESSSPTLTNVTFSNNSAPISGGGMENHEYSNPTLVDVTFSENWAERGGGMYNYESSPTLTNVTFSGNWSTVAGGGMRNILSSSPTLNNVTFEGNSAELYGGGMNNYESSPTLMNVTFSENWAEFGGGMYNYESSSPTLTNVTFSGNRSTEFGGGMRNRNGSNPTLMNVLFSGNSSVLYGGGMLNSDSSPILTNVTFSGNRAGYGGGIFNYLTRTLTSTLTVNNSIFWNNQDDSGTGTIGANIYLNGYVITLTHSLLQGSGGSDSWIGGSYVDDGDNIDDDPQFITPVDPVSAPTTAGELQLSHGSPAIDSGDNQYVLGVLYDLDGNSRIINDVVDMGAYETFTKIRVAKTGDGTNGLSWTTAFTNVQDALAAAINVDEIWVATGVYTPGLTVYDSFQLLNGVALYGGFAATETLRMQRDWVANPTVLSGDHGGNDTTDARGVVTDTANISGDNICHVVTGSGVDSSAVLDGFIITAGQAVLEFWPCNEISGGGMYNDNGSPTLNNVIFSGNTAYTGGAGMSNYNYSSPTLTNVTFSGNATSHGGGMWNYNNSNPTLNNVTFSGNVAYYGGGMSNHDSSPTLTDVTFSGNLGYDSGGGMWNETNSSPILTDVTFSENWANSGGGMSNWSSCSPTLTNVTFSENSTDGGGGGMWNYNNSNPTLTGVTFSGNSADMVGGGIYNNHYSSPTLTEVTFSNNSAPNYGGGMYNRWYSSPTLTEVTFSGNSTSKYGGGIAYTDSSTPTLTNVTFSDNSATIEGGGMYNYGNDLSLSEVTFSGNWADKGGGIYNVSSNSMLTNVTFTGNSATIDGGGMSNWGGSSTLISVTFTGNSADNNGGGIYNVSSYSTLTDVTFSSNSATIDGGGMFNENSTLTMANVTFSGNWSTERGGGMYNKSGIPMLTNVTFSGNVADYGGGIYNNQSNSLLTNVILTGNSATFEGGGEYNYYSESNVRNSILWNNQDSSGTGTISANITNDGWDVTLIHCLLQGSGGSDNWIGGSYYDGGGNIDVDPLFIAPVTPEVLSSTAFNLRLSPGSPAIDAGDNQYVEGILFDLAGNRRIINGIVDMSAYETFVYIFLPMIIR